MTDARDDFSTTVVEGDPPVVEVAGEVDLATAGELAAALEPLLATGDGPIVLDVGGVTFIDSSGLAVLAQAAASGRTLVLRRPSKIVVRVIETTGLDQVLTLEP
ncbi:MAG: STAS domain-containing protein [Acidimicrobiales bacterium]